MMFSCFFFFQAEDGIRDIGVTGVQTCALPIFVGGEERRDETVDPVVLGPGAGEDLRGSVARRQRQQLHEVLAAAPDQVRSEERRVGKECRSRWSPYH